jgi:hypothetical protein
MHASSTYPAIAVAGSPGADLTAVVKHLVSKGWVFTWPNQDLSRPGTQEFVQTLWQNPEVRNLHQSLLQAQKISFLDTKFPSWYVDTFPDANAYAAKFNSPFVVSDVLMGPLLDWWSGCIDVVIDVTASPDEDVTALGRMTKNGDPARLRTVRDYHAERRRRHLAKFERVLALTNVELYNGGLQLLERFVRRELRQT